MREGKEFKEESRSINLQVKSKEIPKLTIPSMLSLHIEEAFSRVACNNSAHIFDIESYVG
jgi:hypothetical protein